MINSFSRKNGSYPLQSLPASANASSILQPQSADSLRGLTGSGSGNATPDEVILPYHVYGKGVRYMLVMIVSVAAMLSGLSSNVFFPAQRDIAVGLHVAPSVINISITTYLIAQGFAPSVWGPLADLLGRRTILIVTLLLCVLANIGLALVPNVGLLLAFRAIQAAGSASSIALGAGVIADLADPSERGGYLGLFSGLRQVSIALGPVIGGLLSGSLGFRSIFWFLVIYSAIILVALTLLLPETLRRISGNGSTALKSIWNRPLLANILPYMRNDYVFRRYGEQTGSYLRNASDLEIMPRKKFNLMIFLQPFSMIIEKDVACALFFGSATYTAWSMMVATTTVIFTHAYHFTTIQIGLCFLANGIGCVLGSIFSGRTLNAAFSREADLWNYSNMKSPKTPIPRPLPTSFPIERARLGEAPLYSLIMIIGFLIFGWSLTPPGTPLGDDVQQSAGHWITPLLAQLSIGYCNTAVLNSNNVLIVDLFPGKSSSASAVINLSRNLTAAVGVALVDYLEDSLNPGWLGVVLAGLVVIGLAPLTLHNWRGMVWRSERELRQRGPMPDA